MLDRSSPRRDRRKGVVEPPSLHSLYDYSYGGDDESVSVGEISQRARRTRKDTVNAEKTDQKSVKEPKSSREQKTAKYSKDSKSIKEDTQKKSEAQIKRRNTAKKLDGEKARTTSSRMDKPLGGDDVGGSGQEEKEENPEPDDTKVSFCMWGHENCRTRSHYRYNWQWDYVQKYADQHKKSILSGYLPKEEKPAVKTVVVEEPEKDDNKKIGKDGIKIRLQMLQNKFEQNKSSNTVKQKKFETDLELEMLRRRKKL